MKTIAKTGFETTIRVPKTHDVPSSQTKIQGLTTFMNAVPPWERGDNRKFGVGVLASLTGAQLFYLLIQIRVQYRTPDRNQNKLLTFRRFMI